MAVLPTSKANSYTFAYKKQNKEQEDEEKEDEGQDKYHTVVIKFQK